MAADGYIKAAYGQLTSAVMQLQSEISQLQQQLGQQKSNLENDIKQLQAKHTVHMAEVSNQNLDESQKHYLLSRMDTIKSEQGQKESDKARLDSDINNQIVSKQQALNTIQGSANQINSLLSLGGIK